MEVVVGKVLSGVCVQLAFELVSDSEVILPTRIRLRREPAAYLTSASSEFNFRVKGVRVARPESSKGVIRA